MLQVYLDPCTINCRKVLAGLKHMGVPFETHHIDYFAGEQKSPEYLKVNPNATIPAAIDGDLYITESNAILQYAADTLGGHPAYPADLKQRCQVNRWLLWEGSAWFPACYTYLVEYVVKPLLGNKPDEAVITAAAPRWRQLAGVLDAQLQKTKYLAGDSVTIADFAVAAPMHLHKASKLPLDEYPHLKNWITNLVEKVPAWQETQGAANKALLPNEMNGGSHTGASNGNADPNAVEAIFNYTKDVAPQLTELYFYDTPESEGSHEPGDDPQKVKVLDGWSLADTFTMDKNGFSLHRQFDSSHDEWEDDDIVRDKFYPEVVEFLKAKTGASRVLVFDHTIRTKANQEKKLTEEKNTSQRAPVTLVHCDYTSESAPLRVKQLLPDEADELLKRRVAFVNFWMPLRRPVEEYPLAMCDAASAPQGDLFKLHLRYRDRDGENYVMRYSPDHKWYYFPGMKTDQVILLKTYDSDTAVTRFVGHSAFVDPTSPPDAPTRESIEIRTIAFF